MGNSLNQKNKETKESKQLALQRIDLLSKHPKHNRLKRLFFCIKPVVTNKSYYTETIQVVKVN